MPSNLQEFKEPMGVIFNLTDHPINMFYQGGEIRISPRIKSPPVYMNLIGDLPEGLKLVRI